jgi:5-methylcytosine-specific restriction enzyme B
LPKLLGELVYALEYRGHEVTLPFECEGSRTLTIPKNLYVIATMNSADRLSRTKGIAPISGSSE